MDTSGRQAILACVTKATQELPDSVVEAVATALEAMPIGAPLSEHRIETLIKGIAGPAHRVQLRTLFRGLEGIGSAVAPSSLAWALRGAAAQDATHRAGEDIDLVWTGPKTPALTPRRADGALIEVIDRSKHALYVATFAAYRVSGVKAALERAVERGVGVRLILETSEASGGKVSFDPAKAFTPELLSRMALYIWPRDQRPTDALGRRGSLHMKCAVADGELLLVSSANLTEFAFDLNMELGVLIRSASLGHQLTRHLESLIHQGVLRPQRID